MKEFFSINVNRYDTEKNFEVYRPASLNNPKDNAVMFIGTEYMKLVDVFQRVYNCLIFWPSGINIPEFVKERHAVVVCQNPHLEYCRFYQDNEITCLPSKENGKIVDGAFVADTAEIGENVVIMPGAYIGGEVHIGNNVYIGAGVKLVGTVTIKDNVVIRENTVIGADGLSTDRDENGIAITMPQFGGVLIEQNVQIGANTVIARGAIDNTIIGRGSKIDNQCFISHNVVIGEDTFIVGETIMFGSSSIGNKAYISGNSTIRNGIHIGNNAMIGMGSVVVKNVDEGKIVKGNPAR